jgi:uncharacterized repeat protein (TIGR03803 family)
MRRNNFRTGRSLTLMIFTMMFALAHASWAVEFKPLHKFKYLDGAGLYGRLTMDAAGNLYGTTSYGGNTNGGLVYKLTPNPDGSWGASTLYTFTLGFNAPDGTFPVAGLILDGAGNLYGTTEWGGPDAAGVVFKLTPNPDGSWTESVIHTFDGSDGANPKAGLIFGPNNTLYGTTYSGGSHGRGTVFELVPNPDETFTENVIFNFKGSFGAYPAARLIFDASGNLYGTTTGGGPLHAGVVFKLAPNQDGTWTESVLHTFSITDGWDPQAPLTFDDAGHLFGTTMGGGKYGHGVVFRLKPTPTGHWKERVIHAFGREGGADPAAGLIWDAAGNLHGTTVDGGPANYGTVFKLTPNPDESWKIHVSHVFKGKDGTHPYGGLISDAAGNLYGAARDGGKYNGTGVVFQITP